MNGRRDQQSAEEGKETWNMTGSWINADEDIALTG